MLVDLVVVVQEVEQEQKRKEVDGEAEEVLL